MAINNLRMGGINSGYDTEAMIEQMLSSYQNKIDNQNKKLTKLTWQQDAYRDVTDKLTKFKQKYFDILNKKSYLLSPSSFNNFKSTISGKTLGDDAKGLEVTTTVKSSEGNYNIKLNQLATATKATGKSINPAGFSLNLEKAMESNYTTSLGPAVSSSTGKVKTKRTYEYALDVKVGDITKTVEFDFSLYENSTTGEISFKDYAENFRNALNIQLDKAFGRTGGTVPTGNPDNPEAPEFFLQATWPQNSKEMYFKVGGNAAVSITEKTGNFGLTKLSKSVAISAQSAVTGKNTVAVNVGDDVVKNVTFDGVSDTYYDSRELKGNEKILEEYNTLKEAAYRKENKIYSSAIDEKELAEFNYTSAQAAKDKNTAALEQALNSTFSDDNVSFSIDNGIVTAKKNGSIQATFSMTSVEGGTLGLEKGNVSNKFTEKTKLTDIGITGNNIVVDGTTKEAEYKYSFEINGKKIELEENATVKDLLDAVNKSDAGVTMSYSYITNSFELTSDNLGSAEQIKFDTDSEGKQNRILKELGLLDATVTAGQNAAFEINGVVVRHNSNTYTTDNTTFKFTDSMKIGEEYQVGVSKSYDDIKQNIKDFVKDYNQLIDDVYGHIGTAPARDEKNNTYDPLTDAQKEEMDEKEIEKWETAAKKGVIYHDTTVSSIMTQIRTTLYNGITLDDGKKFTLYNMGISTVSFRESPYDDAMRGKLTIDEDALNKAFEENTDAIVKLFTDADNGIMSKVNKVLDNAVRTTGKVKGSLINKAGTKSTSVKDNYIYRQMESIKKRINTLQDRYDSKEDYWWKVFTNLESAMGDFNNQSAYLANYLGGFGGTTG